MSLNLVQFYAVASLMAFEQCRAATVIGQNDTAKTHACTS